MKYAEMEKVAEITEELYHKAASTARQKGKELKKAIRKKASAERKLEIWPRLRVMPIAILATLGFFGGTIVSIEEMLRLHGYTATIWGTLCATAIYIASGTLISLVFGYIGKAWADHIEADLQEKQANLGDEIACLQAEISDLRQKAEDLCSVASQ